MTDWITRAQIGLRPRNGGGIQLRVADVDGYAWHWPGMKSPIDARGDIGFRRVCSALRGWQAYHMDTRGWSDIAYMGAVDQVGRKYTLRGVNIKSGANGDNDVNTRFGAFLLILAPGEKPSAAMVEAVKEVGAEFCHRFTGARKKPYGHRDVRPTNSQGQPTTDCPGPLAEAAIQAGTFTPGAVAPPATPSIPVEEDPMAALTKADIQAAMEAALEIKLQRWTRADNAHDDQVVSWDATAQAYATLRFEELRSQGVSYPEAFTMVRDELRDLTRPLWES